MMVYDRNYNPPCGYLAQEIELMLGLPQHYIFTEGRDVVCEHLGIDPEKTCDLFIPTPHLNRNKATIARSLRHLANTGELPKP